MGIVWKTLFTTSLFSMASLAMGVRTHPGATVLTRPRGTILTISARTHEGDEPDDHDEEERQEVVPFLRVRMKPYMSALLDDE
jgi:hypothetical protein